LAPWRQGVAGAVQRSRGRFVREALSPAKILEQAFSWFIALQDWNLRLKDVMRNKT
jgi:hypothetical protein